MDEFEIHLVSNNSLGIFPDNKLSSFTTFLPEEIHLEGVWQTAIVEIAFPATIENIAAGEIMSLKMRYENDDGTRDWSITDYMSSGEKYTKEFDAGTYREVDDIIKVINSFSGADFTFKVSDITNKIEIACPYNRKVVFNTKNVPLMLGLDSNEIGWPDDYDNKGEDYILSGKTPVDLVFGKHMLFIYINIIEHQTVGDTKAPILRLVPMQHRLRNCSLQEISSLTYRSFNDLQYKTLLKSTFRYIQIELRTETGELFPFSSTGYTALTLKFRRVDSFTQ